MLSIYNDFNIIFRHFAPKSRIIFLAYFLKFFPPRTHFSFVGISNLSNLVSSEFSLEFLPNELLLNVPANLFPRLHIIRRSTGACRASVLVARFLKMPPRRPDFNLDGWQHFFVYSFAAQEDLWCVGSHRWVGKIKSTTSHKPEIMVPSQPPRSCCIPLSGS